MNELMYREITSQPKYLEYCLPILRDSISKLRFNCNRIVMGGCGDSYFSSIAVSVIFDKLNISFKYATSQEIEQFSTLLPSDLIVLVSISGTTRRTINAAKRAVKMGSQTLAITCNPNSPLPLICDQVVVLPYQSITRKTPHTLDYIITLLSQVLIAEKFSDTSFSDLDDLSDALNKFIIISLKEIDRLVNNIQSDISFIFLGAGDSLGTAMYGAAKFHEAGGIAAYSNEIENFWHGHHFMVQPDDVILIFGNKRESTADVQFQTDTFNQLTSNILYVGRGDSKAPFDLERPINNIIIKPFLDSIAPQVLCYTYANSIGLEVDNPDSKLQQKQANILAQNTWFEGKPENI